MYNDELCIQRKAKLEGLLKDYESHDVFNADETALFYKCLPDKTRLSKTEETQQGQGGSYYE